MTTIARPDLASRLRDTDERISRRLTARSTLLDIMRAMGAAAEPADMASRALEQASHWLPAPVWSLWAIDAAGEASVLATREGTEATHTATGAVVDCVLKDTSDFVSADLTRDPRVETRLTGSVLAFPLRARQRLVGVLVASDPRPSSRVPRLGTAALAGLRGLLEAVASPLDRALALKRVEALSVTDDLTLLYNSRYLNQVLRRETKRAIRNGRPLSVLFIDLDGFKSINDTYGHSSGSRALVEAGNVIRASARETDIAARFGGDEFALILPDTGGPGAMQVAERVRERIAAHAFLAGDGLSIHLTASVGVATLPDAAQSADELIEMADAAMYFVKDRGKNAVHAAAAVDR